MDIQQYMTRYIQNKVGTFTLFHIIYFIIGTAITIYITRYFLQFKLFKWIYVGTLIVLIATLYNQGRSEDREEIAEEIFKLALIK